MTVNELKNYWIGRLVLGTASLGVSLRSDRCESIGEAIVNKNEKLRAGDVAIIVDTHGSGHNMQLHVVTTTGSGWVSFIWVKNLT